MIGVGNTWRGDDGAGIAVARLVSACAPPGVTVLEHDGEPASLLEAWAGVRTALIVDAVSSGAVPGTVRRIDASAAPLPVTLGSASTHGVGVAEAIELGRALGRLPEQIVVYSIEGEDFGARTELAPAIRRAVRPAADAVLAELDAIRR